MQQKFLLQILLLAQHVSGTTIPIIRSSRVLYSGCCLWYLVLWFSSCWSGVELWVVCPVCRMLQHCLLNMFRAPLCPSSGAQEYYTVVAACGVWCCGFQVVGLVWSCGLCVRFAGCCSITCSTCFGHHYAHHQEIKIIIQWLLSAVFGAVAFKLLVWCGSVGYVSGLQDAKAASCSTPDQQLESHSTKYHRQQPLYNTLELQMMGIVVPETC